MTDPAPLTDEDRASDPLWALVIDTAERVNAVLHAGLGVSDPCDTACTHIVTGEWTALGIANVIARAEA